MKIFRWKFKQLVCNSFESPESEKCRVTPRLNVALWERLHQYFQRVLQELRYHGIQTQKDFLFENPTYLGSFKYEVMTDQNQCINLYDFFYISEFSTMGEYFESSEYKNKHDVSLACLKKNEDRKLSGMFQYQILSILYWGINKRLSFEDAKLFCELTKLVISKNKVPRIL